MSARDFVKEMKLDEEGEQEEEEFCSRSGLQVTWPDAQLLHYNIAHVKAYSSDTAISRLWTASVVGSKRRRTTAEMNVAHFCEFTAPSVVFLHNNICRHKHNYVYWYGGYYPLSN